MVDDLVSANDFLYSEHHVTADEVPEPVGVAYTTLRRPHERVYRRRRAYLKEPRGSF
jgi:hypothetical protein